MRTIAVVGAKGFVGKALCEALARLPDYKVISVTRENYTEAQKDEFDILINAAMPAARFWAKNNPREDFVETVQKTANLVYGWHFKKFIQISTISARSQPDTVYGRHKAAAEKISGFGNNLIVRLGAMYDPSLKKGVLVDMLQGKKVFVTGESRYCFAPLDFVVNWIATHLDQSGIIEVGGRNAITLKEIAEHIGAKVEFEGAIDHQEIEKPDPEYPEARAVLAFMDFWKKQF